ncbi:hypothetical protein LCGC14_1323710 [marine sediment metagenome]|uniref:Uncharacterized protein n=1 Tax=marine sediment metagenome TaxID=412755 RepID=A0A0F9NL50_9ZZZZ
MDLRICPICQSEVRSILPGEKMEGIVVCENEHYIHYVNKGDVHIMKRTEKNIWEELYVGGYDPCNSN